jgi:nucleoside-diphosphate-sugar epimerase
LAHKLIELEFNLYGLVKPDSYYELESLKDIRDRVKLLEADLADYHSVLSVTKAAKPDFVLHLGAITPVRLSFEKPFSYIETVAKGSANVIHAIIETAPQARLIMSSTAEVYGSQDTRTPLSEEANLHPMSPYAISKLFADCYAQMAGKAYGLRYTVLRPSNSYGRKLNRSYMVEYLVTAMLSRHDVFVGAPDSVRDYTHISDHVEGLLAAMQSDKAEGQVLNISTSVATSNRSLAERIAELTGFGGQIKYGVYPPSYPTRPVSADPPYLVLDNTRIRMLTGWKPRIALDQGLKMAVEYWRRNLLS